MAAIRLGSRLNKYFCSRVPQVAERNNLTDLLPFKTLEEAHAAYNFGCLQARPGVRMAGLSTSCS